MEKCGRHDWKFTRAVDVVSGATLASPSATFCKRCTAVGTMVLVCRCGAVPERDAIPRKDGLDAMQAIVGGLVTCVSLDDGVDVWCNDEALCLGMPLNRRIPAAARQCPPGWEDVPVIHASEGLADYGEAGEWRIHGDFFMSRTDDAGELAPLTEEDVAKYTALFKVDLRAMFDMQMWRASTGAQRAER